MNYFQNVNVKLSVLFWLKAKQSEAKKSGAEIMYLQQKAISVNNNVNTHIHRWGIDL